MVWAQYICDADSQFAWIRKYLSGDVPSSGEAFIDAGEFHSGRRRAPFQQRQDPRSRISVPPTQLFLQAGLVKRLIEFCLSELFLFFF